MVRKVDPEVEEIQFNDALTANLRRGRFLLLIVGDGIREGVEAIAEYLHAHAGLHFSLGLVELPIYVMPNGDRLVAPRVLARTALVTRNVVAVPDGYGVEEEDPGGEDIDTPPGEYERFWTEFLTVLKLDDPEQPRAKPTRGPNIRFPLPAPNSWLSVYRLQNGHLGVFLSSRRNTPGRNAMRVIVEDLDTIKDQLGGNVRLEKVDGDDSIGDWIQAGQMDLPEERQRVLSWLAQRVNTFVNVLRPRMRAAASDYQSRGE